MPYYCTTPISSSLSHLDWEHRHVVYQASQVENSEKLKSNSRTRKKRVRMRLRAAYIVLFILLLNTNWAIADEKPADYALAMDSATQAFICHALAVEIDSINTDHLLDFGYKNAMFVIQDLKDKKITQNVFEDIAFEHDGPLKDVPNLKLKNPLRTLFTLKGPNADFIVGRIYEGSAGSVMEKLYREPQYMRLSRKEFSTNEFRKRNCDSFILKTK